MIIYSLGVGKRRNNVFKSNKTSHERTHLQFLQEAEDRVSRVNESLKKLSDADDSTRRQRSDRGGFGRGRSRSRSRDRNRRARSRSRDR